ncbi:putative lipoprotein YjhA precursor [compost metagenome]
MNELLRRNQNIVLVLTMLSLLSVLIGCTAETPMVFNQDQGSNAATKREETSQNKAPAPEDKIFAIGEKIALGDNILTVNGFDRTQGDNEFDYPKEGHEYIIVDVTIENGGSENISYNPFDFTMQNSQGQILDGTFTLTEQDRQLNSGALAPKGKVSGVIVFEQPKGDTGLQVIYQPNFWNDGKIKIELK